MNEEIIDQFPKIVFETKQDKDNFLFYFNSRGYGIYKTTYKILESLVGDSFTYKQFSDFIRYDKTIRDYLYKFYALYEEQLVDLISYHVKYIGEGPIDDMNYNDKYKEIIPNKNLEYDFAFFNNVNLSLGKLYKLMSKDKFNIKCKSETFDKVQDLRNKIMHHSVLLVDLSKEITKSNLLKRKNLIEREINVFLGQINIFYKNAFLSLLDRLNSKTSSPLKIEL